MVLVEHHLDEDGSGQAKFLRDIFIGKTDTRDCSQVLLKLLLSSCSAQGSGYPETFAV
jgi:hypothetical protein